MVFVGLLIVGAALLGGYAFLFGLARRVNEWYYVDRVQRKTEFPLPPGNMGWPFLGNMPTFLKAFRSVDPESFIYDLVSRYGKTGMYRSYLFGRPSIIVCSPETCRKVLTQDQQFKLGYPASTVALTGNTSFHQIFNADKRFRRLASSPMGQTALALHIERFEEIMLSSLEEWASISMKHPVELFGEMKKATFKVIIHIFMGSNYNHSTLTKIEDLFSHLLNGVHASAINLPGFAFHKALKARRKLESIVQTVVSERRMMMIKGGEEEGKKHDLLDILLGVEGENGRKMEDKDIVDLLVVFLFAGQITTALAIAWSLIFLTEHPQIMKKAKEEQEEIMKTRPSSQKGLNLKEIKQMVYLAKVIDETLRLGNLTFSPFRLANDDVNINGYTIPKGWKVIVWARAVHMDPQYHANPREFNPSRWDGYNPQSGSFFPFGAGIRLCPGRDLAKLAISIFLHHFLLNYKMERVNPKCRINYLPVPRPVDNCLARIMKLVHEASARFVSPPV